MTTRRIALLFPGHGSEHPGMGRDLLNDASRARHIEAAGEFGGFDARRMLLRGGPAFHDTRVVQPLLTSLCVAWLEALQEHDFEYDLVLGHSLGELSAWHATGAMTPEAAIELAAKRGALLGEIADSRPGAMWSWRGSVSERESLESSLPGGVIDLAVHNAPSFWVYSGDATPLASWLGPAGGRRLEASGPWHCRWMREGQTEFAQWVAKVDGPRNRANIICNQAGKLRDTEEDFTQPFVSQMSSTVQFATAMATLAALAPDEVVIIGPSKVVQSLVRENWGTPPTRAPRVWRLEGLRDFEALIRCRDAGWPHESEAGR